MANCSFSKNKNNLQYYSWLFCFVLFGLVWFRLVLFGFCVLFCFVFCLVLFCFVKSVCGVGAGAHGCVFLKLGDK